MGLYVIQSIGKSIDAQPNISYNIYADNSTARTLRRYFRYFVKPLGYWEEAIPGPGNILVWSKLSVEEYQKLNTRIGDDDPLPDGEYFDHLKAQHAAVHEALNITTTKELLQLLNILKPEQRLPFLTEYQPALDIYTQQIAEQKYALWNLLDFKSCNDVQRTILFKATLKGYSQFQHTHKPRWAYYNKLAQTKTALVDETLNSTENHDFNEIYTSLEYSHQRLAHKTNRMWLFSNRWQFRIGIKFGDRKNEPWNENKHSKLGNIINRFKK